jgi:hypothetical protein
VKVDILKSNQTVREAQSQMQHLISQDVELQRLYAELEGRQTPSTPSDNFIEGTTQEL